MELQGHELDENSKSVPQLLWQGLSNRRFTLDVFQLCSSVVHHRTALLHFNQCGSSHWSHILCSRSLLTCIAAPRSVYLLHITAIIHNYVLSYEQLPLWLSLRGEALQNWFQAVISHRVKHLLEPYMLESCRPG